MDQNPTLPHQIAAGTGGWGWPRLLRQLGIGPSAASMLAGPYLHQLRTPTTAPPPPRGGRS